MLDNTSSTASGISVASRPLHTAGNARIATRSRSWLRRVAVSLGRVTTWFGGSSEELLLSGVVSIAGPCAQLTQELIGWNEEGVLLQNAGNHDHGVSAEDIHYDACAKLGEIVDSENGIRVLREDVVEARLVFHQVIHARSILQRPFHVRHQSSQGKPALLAFGEHLLDQGQHGGLVEVTAAQIGFLPGAQLQLTALLDGGDVDTRGRQPFDVIAAQFRIHDVESLLPVRETLLDEGQEDAVLLVPGVEERAHVAVTPEPCSREGHRPLALFISHARLRYRCEVPRSCPSEIIASPAASRPIACHNRIE